MTFHFLSHISSDSIYHFTTENLDWEVSVLFSAFHVSTLKLSIFVVRFDKLPIFYFEVERERAREAMKSFSRSDPWILKSTRFCLSLTHTFSDDASRGWRRKEILFLHLRIDRTFSLLRNCGNFLSNFLCLLRVLNAEFSEFAESRRSFINFLKMLAHCLLIILVR